ncbi:MAG: CPBP family intramembrane metalloprotease [Lachnospiraceae bacterium]|nr:CPBP family intramembrane metalloprotease [Lachnospiraceae bacterium]
MKQTMPLWKWITLIILGPLFFLFLSQIVPIIGTLSNSWIGKAVLLFLGSFVVLGLYALYIKVFEKRTPYELKLKTSLPNLLLGFTIGGLFIVCVIGVLALFGVYRIGAISIDWIGLILNFAMFSIVAVSEEIIFRGLLFRMINDRFSTILAFIISSLLFGIIHLTTVDFLTAMAISVEAGFMLAAAYKLWNNLWVPIGIHWAWNFFLGPIFGVGVSGISQDACVIIPKITGPYILTGGDNGFEGSIVTFLLGLSIGLVLLRYKTHKN